MEIHGIALYSVSLSISAALYKYHYITINIDDHESECLYVVYFSSIAYTLQGSIEVNFDTIT